MASFFDTTTSATLKADLEDFLNVPGTINVSDWKPAERDARNAHLIPVLSDEFITELLAASSPTANQTALIGKIKPAIAKLTMLALIPKLNINFRAKGFSQDASNNETPAPFYSIRDLKRTTVKEASVELDLLLKYLEKNADDFATYTDSEEYAINQGNFVNQTAKAARYQPLITSHFVFRSIRPRMKQVDEAIIKPALTTTLYDHLLALAKTGADWGDYLPLKEHIEAAEIHFAFADSLEMGAVSYNDDFKLHVPLISEQETGRRADKTDANQREQLTRAANAYGTDAINQIKSLLKENAEDWDLYTAPTLPQKAIIKNTEPEDPLAIKQAAYFGLGLPPKR